RRVLLVHRRKERETRRCRWRSTYKSKCRENRRQRFTRRSSGIWASTCWASRMAINYLGRLATSRDALQTKMNLICGIAGTPTVPVRKIRHIEDVLSLLATFPDCAGYAANRRGEPLFDLETEAGVQDLVYLILRLSVPDLVSD